MASKHRFVFVGLDMSGNPVKGEIVAMTMRDCLDLCDAQNLSVQGIITKEQVSAEAPVGFAQLQPTYLACRRDDRLQIHINTWVDLGSTKEGGKP